MKINSALLIQLLLLFLLNLEKTSFSCNVVHILDQYTVWFQCIVYLFCHLGQFVAFLSSNAFLHFVMPRSFYQSSIVSSWSCLYILHTLFLGINSISTIRFCIGFFEGLLICSIFNSFKNLNESESQIHYLLLTTAQCVGASLGFILQYYVFWKNIYLAIGIVGCLVSILIFKTKINIFIISSAFESNGYELEKKSLSLLKFKEFFYHLPLWAIFISHSSTSWLLQNGLCWSQLFMRNIYYVDKYSLTNLFLAPILFLACAIVSLIFYRLVQRICQPQLLNRITTVFALLGSGFMSMCLIYPLSVTGNYIIISCMIGLCGFNQNGSFLSHYDSSQAENSLIVFILSNAICSVANGVNSLMNAFLITESHYRFTPMFILATVIPIVGAIVYLVESAILTKENSRIKDSVSV